MMSLVFFLTSCFFAGLFFNVGVNGYDLVHIMGSMSNKMQREYPFLTDDDTKQFIHKSKTLFIIRKSSEGQRSPLASEIQERYPNSIICPEDGNLSQVAEKETRNVFQCVEEACKANTTVVIVDNSKVQKQNLQKYTEIVKKNNYIEILTGGNKGADIVYPLFYGWYVNEKDSMSLRSFSTEIYMELLKNPEFKEEFEKHVLPGAKTEGGQVDLPNYFSTDEFDVGPTMLHCTAFFSDFGKVAGSKEYATSDAVMSDLGKKLTLELIGLIVTPKTFGFRMKLNNEQLMLWGEEDKDPGPKWTPSHFNPTAGKGSKSHMSIGCGPKIPPVQTGNDLADIIQKEVDDVHEGTGDKRLKVTFSLGQARYYDEGYWGVYLNSSKKVNALFSGFY